MTLSISSVLMRWSSLYEVTNLAEVDRDNVETGRRLDGDVIYLHETLVWSVTLARNINKEKKRRFIFKLVLFIKLVLKIASLLFIHEIH